MSTTLKVGKTDTLLIKGNTTGPIHDVVVNATYQPQYVSIGAVTAVEDGWQCIITGQPLGANPSANVVVIIDAKNSLNNALQITEQYTIMPSEPVSTSLVVTHNVEA